MVSSRQASSLSFPEEFGGGFCVRRPAAYAQTGGRTNAAIPTTATLPSLLGTKLCLWMSEQLLDMLDPQLFEHLAREDFAIFP